MTSVPQHNHHPQSAGGYYRRAGLPLPTFSLAAGIDRSFIEEVIEYCANNAYDETLESLFKALEEDDMGLYECVLDEMLEDEFDR